MITSHIMPPPSSLYRQRTDTWFIDHTKGSRIGSPERSKLCCHRRVCFWRVACFSDRGTFIEEVCLQEKSSGSRPILGKWSSESKLPA